jgi:hypothetical protein
MHCIIDSEYSMQIYIYYIYSSVLNNLYVHLTRKKYELQ